MMQHLTIPVNKLEMNTGQIDGLPANPRQWTREELERLKKSLTETPELFEARGVLCIPRGKKYVVLGGNMRLTAAKENGAKDVPCIVVPEDTPVQKLKELVIKDNGTFGENDWDALANEWDDCPLNDWGIPAWNAPDAEEFVPTIEDTEREGADYDNAKMTFQFKAEEFGFVSDALMMIDANKENALLKLLGYEKTSTKE